MALSWSAKRQLTIFGILFGTIALIVFLFVRNAVSETPTCFDKKQNGTERGVDCGGSCVLYCKGELLPVAVKYSRTFPVTDSVWSAIAYVENQNYDAAVSRIQYQFRLYDEEQRFIGERTGETYIGLTGPTAIFEGGIQVGSRVPKSVRFTFMSEPYWQRPDSRANEIVLLGEPGVLSNTETRPKLSGTVRNTSSLYTARDVEVVGIVYDVEGNAIAISSTIVSEIVPGEEVPVTFTWPSRFSAEGVKTEILPRFNPLIQRF